MDAHKDPADRAHLWERPTMPHEEPPAPIDPHFPRHVHQPGGVWKAVGDQAALDAALADGWELTPRPLPPADEA